jgi:hypothetical protein
VPRHRVRRPLLALVALLVALAIGYGVRALRSDDSAPKRTPASTSTQSMPDRPAMLAVTRPPMTHT